MATVESGIALTGTNSMRPIRVGLTKIEDIANAVRVIASGRERGERDNAPLRIPKTPLLTEAQGQTAR